LVGESIIYSVVCDWLYRGSLSGQPAATWDGLLGLKHRVW
jgi:hypothetical protein